MGHLIRLAVPAVLVAAASFAADPQPIRLLVGTGGHLHNASFYELFVNRKDFQVEVDGHPSIFRRDLTKTTDVLVLYDLADVTEEPRRKNLRAFVENGGGVVLLHHAIADNQQWPWWTEEVAGGKYLLQPEKGLAQSTFQHDVEFTVRPVGDHPITRGIQPFKILDECYKGMWISPKVKLLLETGDPHNDRPVAWIGPHAKARVVYIQLGHGTEAHEHPAYRKLVDNAIRWAARRLN
jgi:type 1 glutamine amidotransferase